MILPNDKKVIVLLLCVCIHMSSERYFRRTSDGENSFWTCELPMIQILPGMIIGAQYGHIHVLTGFCSPVLLGLF